MKTINQLDEEMVRPNGNGSSAKAGHKAYVVADSNDRRDRESTVVSVHRTSRGAIKAAKAGQSVWMWDTYMGHEGGYRPMPI